jgi:hypothetical protein
MMPPPSNASAASRLTGGARRLSADIVGGEVKQRATKIER